MNKFLLTYKIGEGTSPYQNHFNWFQTEKELIGFVNHFKDTPGFEVIEAMEILKKRDIHTDDEK